MSRSMDDFGADARVGEDFQKQAVGKSAVDEVYAMNSRLQGLNGTPDLWQHARCDYSRFLQWLDLTNWKA